MGEPIAWWRDDPDYYAAVDARRPPHLAEIRRRRRLDAQVAAAAADGSYAVLVKREASHG